MVKKELKSRTKIAKDIDTKLESTSKESKKFETFPKVKVKKSSAGLGLFAMEPIKKGVQIIQYVGPKVLSKWADEHPNKYIFEINRKWSIDGSPRYNTARYVNHACKPNAESELESGKIFYRSVKKINEGEEITIDYDSYYFNEYIKPFGCRCLTCKKGDRKESVA